MPILHNYHTHTTRCKHATGEDRAYVETAIQAGLLTLGFSDHTPYPFTNGYHSPVRMACEELEGYVQSVLDLKKEYASDIRILLGLEVEYYPEFFDGWQKLTAEFPFDYFILATHFIGNEYEGVGSAAKTSDPARLAAYVEQTIRAMDAGKFLYLAHPDLIRFTDLDSDVYRTNITLLCKAAKERGVPLEINLLGIRDHRWYPAQQLWQIAGEVGNDVVIGADAHQPEALLRQDAVETAFDMIRRHHLHWVEQPL